MSDISLAASGFDSNKRPQGRSYTSPPPEATERAVNPSTANLAESTNTGGPPTVIANAQNEAQPSAAVGIDATSPQKNETTGINPFATAAQESIATPSENSTSPPSQSLEQTITQLNDYVQSIQRELQFSIDEESGDTIVKVIEKATNEVVRQIPAEDLMETLKSLNQNATTGVIISNQA
jgi:flagellar protein FlaG